MMVEWLVDSKEQKRAVLKVVRMAVVTAVVTVVVMVELKGH